MSCAPFRVEHSRIRLPLFPTERACRALLETEHPDCACRQYPARGWYVLGACGHAHGWNLAREHADAQALRLNREAAAGQAGMTGAPVAGPGTGQAEPPPSTGLFEDLDARGAAADAEGDVLEGRPL